MRKKRKFTLELKKTKIANLRFLDSIKGGTDTADLCNTGDTGTDGDSRRDCYPDPNTDGDGTSGPYTATCVDVCPSLAITLFGC